MTYGANPQRIHLAATPFRYAPRFLRLSHDRPRTARLHAPPRWTFWPFRGTILAAFVALVLPFDSFEGAASPTLAAFFVGLRAVAGLGRSAGVQPAVIPADGPRVTMQF